MSCHITLYDCRLHMKHPELFIGVRACHPSTLRWTERVVLCFFCPAGGGRVPWSKVWRCRGPWSIMGFPDYHEMIITFLNITVSSTKQNILDQFFFWDVLGFHSLVAAFPRRSSMVMKQHARVLTREKPMWNSWAGRTAGCVFHGISCYFMVFLTKSNIPSVNHTGTIENPL